MINPSNGRISDISGMSYGSDCNVVQCDNENIQDDTVFISPDDDGYINLQYLTMNVFRKRLIIHFNIAFE